MPLKKACLNAGEQGSDHFADIGKMIDLGKGAQREVEYITLKTQKSPGKT